MIQSLSKSIAKIFASRPPFVAGGRFTTAGTGALTVSESNGCTVARTGVATYLVTFAVPFREIVLLAANQGSAAVDFRMSAFSASAKTATITAYAAGTATATEQTGPIVHFLAVLYQ